MTVDNPYELDDPATEKADGASTKASADFVPTGIENGLSGDEGKENLSLDDGKARLC